MSASACSFRWERESRANGHTHVCGIDEAGRGPLAGPVAVAAVLFTGDLVPEGLDDSKKLTALRREKLCDRLTSDPQVRWTCQMIEADEIDRINILQATWKGMRACVEELSPRPTMALIDGLAVKGFPIEQNPIVGGDRISLSIAAASIIAKVHRDRVMMELARQYPEYGFERHKGYGTAAHLDALRRYGPCPAHRKSFAPVARCLAPANEAKIHSRGGSLPLDLPGERFV